MENFNRMIRSIYRSYGVLVCALLCVAAPSLAQSTSGDTFKQSADKVLLTPNGLSLQGNAVIVLPQLEVRASTINFDFQQKQITKVRAWTKVNIKVNMVPKKGSVKPGETAVITHIEANCTEAYLDPPKRELILTGSVDGYFQVGDGPRTTLAGSKVVATYVGDQPNVKITGPVKLTVPPEKGTQAPIGTVVITSRDAELDQKTGEVRFIGDARAVSIDGANKFDVSAPSMVITRAQDNSIDVLKTVGRTRLIIDLPPEPAVAPATMPGISATPGQPAIATPPPATPAPTPGARDKVGKPTRVEVEADNAVVNRSTSTMVFEGNVKGSYFLAPAGGEPQKYDFAGNRATITYIPEGQATAEKPAGLKADITGAPNKPVEVFTPSFNLDMGG